VDVVGTAPVGAAAFGGGEADGSVRRRSGRSKEIGPLGADEPATDEAATDEPAADEATTEPEGPAVAALGRRRRRRYGRSPRRGANFGSVITAQTVSP
jgi:hypothetical protein